MKRRLGVWIIAFALLLASCAQAAVPSPEDANGNISVVATIFAPYDFAREIAGDKADVSMLLPPASESHSFEPTAQDIIKIRNCDVFIYTGGESDAWVDTILDSVDTSSMQIVTLMDCVETVEEEIVEGMEGADGEDGTYDEHVWTSPGNAKLIVQKISTALCAADAENAASYRQNTEAYLKELDALDTSFRNIIDNAVRKIIVFGDRFPFRYFADAYGLEYYAAFPGCASETEPSAKTVAFLINKITEEDIPVIFHIELSNKQMAETISEATGAKVMLLHSCHNISLDDFQNGFTYLDLMQLNTEVLKEALG